MTKLKIKVTKDVLIRSANCGGGESNTNCAIALAVRDIFPKAFVCTSFMNFDIDDVGNAAAPISFLPPKASQFIREFDSMLPEYRMNMNEIEFEIEVPDDVINKINIDEIKPLLENHPTLELIEN